MVEYFTGIEEKMPLSAAPEPKRRFLPSKHEAKRIMKIVRAIREGRILPYRPQKSVKRKRKRRCIIIFGKRSKLDRIMS